jgi:hypothetical protein
MWGFLAFGLPPMLMPHNNIMALPGQTLLNWIIELAIANYLLIEAGIRFSGLREGVPWRATTLNFGYERMYIPFNFINVQRRLWSKSSAGFNITGSLATPYKTNVWGQDPSTAPLHLRQSLVASGINLGAMGHIINTTVVDGILRQDIMSLIGGSLLLWPGLDLYYTMKGMIELNDGLEPIDVDMKAMRRYAEGVKKITPKPLLFDAYGKPVGGTS